MAGKVVNPGGYWPGVDAADPQPVETWHEGFSYDRVGNSIPYVCQCVDGRHGRQHRVPADRIIADHNAANDRDMLPAQLADEKFYKEFAQNQVNELSKATIKNMNTINTLEAWAVEARNALESPLMNIVDALPAQLNDNMIERWRRVREIAEKQWSLLARYPGGEA